MDLSRLGSVLLTRRGAVTDVGLVCPRNEDSWLASLPLFATADGAGSHMGGALMSLTAMRVLEDRLSADALGGRRADLVDLSKGARRTAQAVAALADPEDSAATPGSILMGVLVLDTEWGPSWLSSNIGDSRIYIVGGDSICQVTCDHSAVQEARDLVELTGEELVLSLLNAVAHALGVGMAVVPDTGYALVPLFQGDCALMCSDGVHGVLDGEMIVQTVCLGGEPQQITNELVDAAITSGTRDNTTIVVVYALRASWAGGACEVHSRQIRAVRSTSVAIVRRGIN